MIVRNLKNTTVSLHDLDNFPIGPQKEVDLAKYFSYNRIVNAVSIKTALANGWLVQGDGYEKKEELTRLEYIKKIDIPSNKKVDFIWDGLVLDMCGYGTVSRNICYKLAMDGYKFSIERPIHYADWSQCLNPTQVSVLKQLCSFKGSSKVCVCNRSLVSVNVLNDHSKYQIMYTITESRGLNTYSRKQLIKASEVWLPSDMDVQNFKETGFNRVFKVQQGTNIDVFNDKVLVDKKLRDKCKGFVFLACGENEYRKGYDVLLKAYFKAFTNKDDVTLIIMCHEFNLFNYRQILNTPNAPHYIVISSRLKEQEIPCIYKCADVIVSCSRGEGWQMCTNDAGAMGIPCIVPNVPAGYHEYLNSENSWMVDHKIFGKDRVLNQQDPLYCELNQFPLYGDKFIKDYAEVMHHVYKHRNEIKVKGQKLKENIIRNFTWDNTVEQIKFRLSELPISEIQVKIRNPKTIVKKKCNPKLPTVAVYMRGGIGDLVKWSSVFIGLQKNLKANWKVFTRVDNEIIGHLDYNEITKVSEDFMRCFSGDYDMIVSLCHLPYLHFIKDRTDLKWLKERWLKYGHKEAVNEGWAGKKLMELGKNKLDVFNEILGLGISDNDMSVNVKEFDIKDIK